MRPTPTNDVGPKRLRVESNSVLVISWVVAAGAKAENIKIEPSGTHFANFREHSRKIITRRKVVDFLDSGKQ